MAITKEKLLEVLEQLPEDKLSIVADFALSLNKKERNNPKISKFKTAKLGEMKPFDRGKLYDEYLSDRF